MSLHPEYADAILRGTKRVEFRKRRLAPDIGLVVIYATSPVQKVLGWFKIKDTIEGVPSQIWQKVGRHGGITKSAFDAYYSNSSKAVALVIGETSTFASGVALNDISPSLVPPQSFNYVPSAFLSGRL